MKLFSLSYEVGHRNTPSICSRAGGKHLLCAFRICVGNFSVGRLRSGKSCLRRGYPLDGSQSLCMSFTAGWRGFALLNTLSLFLCWQSVNLTENRPACYTKTAETSKQLVGTPKFKDGPGYTSGNVRSICSVRLGAPTYFFLLLN